MIVGIFSMLLRVQDKEGRGPFKPGITIQWCQSSSRLPSILEEFPDIVEALAPFHKRGMHLGCGVRGREQLNRWFNDEELRRLSKLGYAIVSINDYEVVKESSNQVIFASKRPLWKWNAI